MASANRADNPFEIRAVQRAEKTTRENLGDVVLAVTASVAATRGAWIGWNYLVVFQLLSGVIPAHAAKHAYFFY